MTEKKITRQRPTLYPVQVVIMATEETGKALAEEAAAATKASGRKVSKSVIARRWLDAGREFEAHLEGREIDDVQP